VPLLLTAVRRAIRLDAIRPGGRRALDSKGSIRRDGGGHLTAKYSFSIDLPR